MAMVLDTVPSTGDPVLAGVIMLSSIVSFLLALFGILAYRQRRTKAYLLVATAFVAFFLKSVVGILFLVGVVRIESHHLIEHSLDVLVVVLLIGAVSVARNATRPEELPFDESGD